MTTPTSPWNIPLFAPSDTIPSLEGVLNSISTGLNTALNTLSLQAIPQVASQAARNTLFPTPAQGNAVFRTDLMQAQMYFGVYNSATNKFGRRVAGWYPMPWQGSVRCVPTGGSPVVVSGAGSSFSVDELGHVRATSANSVQINGIFLRGARRHIVNVDWSGSGSDFVSLQLATGGTVHAGGGDYNRQYTGMQGGTGNNGGGTDLSFVVGGASGTLPGNAVIAVNGAADDPAATNVVLSATGAMGKAASSIPETFVAGGITTYTAADNDGFKLYMRASGQLASWNIWVDAIY